MTTLRLFYDYFIGETTTIGYDYSRNCYDYSSRNAATIADLYWLSGESPKKAAARAANGSAPPAAGRRKHRNRRRADPVQVETLTPQQVRRVCTADSVSALASDSHTRQELTTPGWYCLRLC